MTQRTFLKTAVGGALMLLAAAPGWSSPAVTLALTSSGEGVYNYSMSFGASPVDFTAGDVIGLSGLSGVYAAGPAFYLQVILGDFYTSTQTPSTVDLTQLGNSGLLVNLPSVCCITLDSSTLTLGTINYSIQTSAGTLTGTAQGPVAASPTPEASSFLLLGTGLIAATAARRKLFRA